MTLLLDVFASLKLCLIGIQLQQGCVQHKYGIRVAIICMGVSFHT